MDKQVNATFKYKGRTVEIRRVPATGSPLWWIRDLDHDGRHINNAVYYTQRKAMAAAKKFINEEVWQGFCDHNISFGIECANNKENFKEWCADREAEGWNDYAEAGENWDTAEAQ